MREYNHFYMITRYILMENPKVEYRSVIKFLVLEGQSPTNIYERMMAVYGDQTPSRPTVFEWARHFKDG
jgi:hypothetical protein